MLLLLTMLCGAARAEEPVYDIDIPSMNAAQALNRFAEQTGAIMLFPYDLANARRTSAVRGRYTLLGGLELLLRGTGLSGGLSDKRVVSISQSGNVQRPGEESPVVNEKPSLRQRFAAFFTSMLAASAASGQDVNADTQALEEIIVTATKRIERLIQVPQAVSVLSSEQIEQLAATQFRDFANTIPGLSFFTLGAGNTQISLRGVTVGTDIGATVGIYVDEVPYGSSSKYGTPQLLALDVGLFDVDRIEVLRGPQGTLYGASTMGGLLKYVTKRPDSTRFGIDAQTGVSSTDGGGISYNGALAVNAPLVSDKAVLRASTFYSHDGGFIDNVGRSADDVNRADIYGGRADLLLMPTEKLNIRLTAFAQNIDREGEATADHALVPASQGFEGPPLTGDLEQTRLSAEPFNNKFRLASATVSYDTDWAEVTSVSSYQEAHSEYFTDISRRFVPLCPLFVQQACSSVSQFATSNVEKFTQEIRLASAEAQTFDWVLGGFYTHEDTEDYAEFKSRDSTGQPRPNDLLATGGPSRYMEYAAFGDLTWHLTSKFDVTGGVRYSWNRQQFEQIGSGVLGGASIPSRESRDEVATYLANARYRFTDNATAYVRYATGYRPGGPNSITVDPVTGQPAVPLTYGSDRLKSYEVGFKAETTGRRFAVDAAIYDIDWDDIIVSVVRGLFAGTANAQGGATIRGAELSITTRPADSFVITGAFGYQDATMAEAEPDLRARKGERLPNVPRVTAALSADYRLPPGNLNPILGATVRHIGDRRSSFDANTTRPQYVAPEYTSVDVYMGLTLGSVDTRLYVHNIADERGELSATFTNLRTARAAVLQPRTIGLTASVRF